MWPQLIFFTLILILVIIGGYYLVNIIFREKEEIQTLLIDKEFHPKKLMKGSHEAKKRKKTKLHPVAENIGDQIKKFRENAVPCSNTNGLCQELINHYDEIHKFHGRDKIIIGLHYLDACGHCIRMIPIWNALINEHNGSKNVVLIQNDENKLRTPGIKSVPTIIKYNGKMIEKWSNGADYDAISAWINKSML